MIAYIGIDPGAKGAVALIYGEDDAATKDLHVEIHNLWTDPALLHAQFDVWALLYPRMIGLIERQVPRAKNGVNNAFAMGGNYRQIQLLCALSAIPLHETLPRTWKEALGLSSDKQKSIDLALELFPDAPLLPTRRSTKASHDRAEALLLAYLARETLGRDVTA